MAKVMVSLPDDDCSRATRPWQRSILRITNVAVRTWRDPDAARRLRGLVQALADDGGLFRVDAALAGDATVIAERHGLWVYDAAYVAGARTAGGQLVSCDLRDLVSQDLALTPEQACGAR